MLIIKAEMSIALINEAKRISENEVRRYKNLLKQAANLKTILTL